MRVVCWCCGQEKDPDKDYKTIQAAKVENQDFHFGFCWTCEEEATIRKSDGWTINGCESFFDESQYSLIESYLYDIITDEDDDIYNGYLPESLLLCSYKLRESTEETLENDTKDLIKSLYKIKKKNYGLDFIPSDVTDGLRGDVKILASEFMKKFDKIYNYERYIRCPSLDVDINVKEWVTKNKPKWLTDKEMNVKFEEDLESENEYDGW